MRASPPNPPALLHSVLPSSFFIFVREPESYRFTSIVSDMEAKNKYINLFKYPMELTGQNKNTIHAHKVPSQYCSSHDEANMI